MRELVAILQRCGRFAPALALLALSSAYACSGQEQLQPVPHGCEDVLVPREAPVRCANTNCAVVQHEPDRKASWTLFVDPYRTDENGDQLSLSASELVPRTNCVIEYLRGLKVGAQSAGHNDRVVFDATYDEAASVLSFSAVLGYEVHCSGADCNRCAALSEKDCRSDDFFCGPLEGDRIDSSHDCVERRYASCRRSDTGCAAVIAYGTDGTGACWRFSSCEPSGDGWDLSNRSPCDASDFMNLASCPTAK